MTIQQFHAIKRARRLCEVSEIYPVSAPIRNLRPASQRRKYMIRNWFWW